MAFRCSFFISSLFQVPGGDWHRNTGRTKTIMSALCATDTWETMAFKYASLMFAFVFMLLAFISISELVVFFWGITIYIRIFIIYFSTYLSELSTMSLFIDLFSV